MKYRPLGYRVLVEPLNLNPLEDSWIWTPPETRQKFKACRVVKIGVGWRHGRDERKRTPMEIQNEDIVLVDLSMGNKEIVMDGKKLLLVSYHDVVARIDR